MPRLHAQVHTTEFLPASDRRDMFALYRNYYDAATEARFTQDLTHKTHAIVLRDEAGVLRGFSTLELFDFVFDATPCQAVFSGDTVIHHEFWGEPGLPMAWLELAGNFKADRPDAPLYWLLIVKGHRTYRYLPLYASHYYPSHNEATPPRMQALADWLAGKRFGEFYDASTGVIRFPDSQGHLAGDWARVPDATAQRPEVAFFLARNPGYVHGDELVCITELSLDNLRRRARVPFARGLTRILHEG